MADGKVVYMQVPMIMSGIDEELNVSSMLKHIMEEQTDMITIHEQHRIAAWFNARYGK